MFDPAVGFFQGRDAAGALEVRAGGLRPARVGPRARLHRDRRLGLRVPRAAGRRRAWRTSTAAATGWREARRVLLHARDRHLPRLLRRHDPRDDRGARRAHGPVGLLQPGLPPHPVHVRLRGPAVQDGRRRSARRCAGCTSAARSGRATPATRTTARPPPGTSSARSASTRCRSAARTTRSARRCSRRRRCTSRTARTSSSARRRTATRTSTCSGLTVNGARLDRAYLAPLRDRERRHARVRHGPAAVEVGDRRRRARRRRSRRATTSPSRCATGRRRRGDRRGRRRGRPVRRRLEHDRGAGRTVGRSTASPAAAAGALLHADLGHARPAATRAAGS